MAAYSEKRYAAALQHFLAFIGQTPDDERAEKAIILIREIGQKVQASEASLTLNKSEWRETVHAARRVAEQRRRADEDTVRLLERLAKQLSTGQTPLAHLREVEIDPSAIDRTQLTPDSEARIDKALADVRSAIHKLPEGTLMDHSEEHELRGYALLFQGKVNDALDAWKKAVAFNPDDPKLKARTRRLEGQLAYRARRAEAQEFTLSGIKDLEASRLEDALQKFRKAAALDPASREIDRHVQRTEQLLTESPRQEKIQTLLAQGKKNFAAGRTLDAVQNWVDVLALEPNHAEARKSILSARERLAQAPPKPLARPKPVVLPRTAPADTAPPPAPLPSIEDPERAEQAYALGLIHYTEGNLKAAERHFGEAVRAQPSLQKAMRALEQVRRERQIR